MVPRTMTQVGLGTARNFSSGRPIFQQLADNIPIAGRAFYEADWELNMHKERENMRRPAKKAAAPKQTSKQLLKAAVKPTVKSSKAPSAAAELEHYFPAPQVPAVTTRLLVPLAPPPTARAPLPEFPPARLPLPALLAIHDEHATHALRVSSLFQRLDTAGRLVPRRRVHRSTPPTRSAPCLAVTFVGWSKAATAYDEHEHEEDDAFSETSSILSGFSLEDAPQVHVDPARSLVLPTLDFSAASSVYARSNSSSSRAWSDDIPIVDPPSENGWFESQALRDENPWFDAFEARADSNSDSDSDHGWLDDSGSENGWLAPPSEPSWLGFSSNFAQRIAEPLESPFA
ncbi:hypothetical protein DFH09DRAFT_1369884 [Mycena vulgaris]|nr:hypothetical protein DFH09DRAFT_1369884 [Mycena vulgaris]